MTTVSFLQVYTLTISIFTIFKYTDGARILGIFPIPAISHFACTEAAMSSLAAAGHNVTIISPFPKNLDGKNYTVIDSSKNLIFYVGKTSLNDFQKSTSTFERYQSGFDMEEPTCQNVLELKEIREMLNSKDIMFVEMFMTYNCFLYLAEKIRIPVIGIVINRSRLFADRSISNPFNPSFLLGELLQLFDFGNFFSRVQNTWDLIQSDYFWYRKVVPFLRNFHEQNKHILHSYSAYLTMQPSLLFYNSHFTYIPRAMNPNAIQIGGIHVKNEKPLPQNIEQFIEGAKYGVVLFTFGSVIKADTLDRERLNAFVEAFAEIPQRVIWKLESVPENVSSNALISKWIPQRDILAHENVKVFVSHCGQGGIYEAIVTETPIIAIPISIDQRSNSIILRKLNVAVVLDIYTISKESIINAIKTVTEGTYPENMQKLSKRFKDRPITPQETVVYWTEYVLRHNGAPHLQTAAATLNWFQYLLLDVVASILFVCVAFMYLMYRLINFCFGRLCQCKINQNQKIKKSE